MANLRHRRMGCYDRRSKTRDSCVSRWFLRCQPVVIFLPIVLFAWLSSLLGPTPACPFAKHTRPPCLPSSCHLTCVPVHIVLDRHLESAKPGTKHPGPLVISSDQRTALPRATSNPSVVSRRTLGIWKSLIAKKSTSPTSDRLQENSKLCAFRRNHLYCLVTVPRTALC
jgi:hypothetical protein